MHSGLVSLKDLIRPPPSRLLDYQNNVTDGGDILVAEETFSMRVCVLTIFLILIRKSCS